ncbi:soluble scavenger receptor cysteine-rich domain-containing protein SSC5D-like isoform X2 [Halichondria panicea]|uniref:soluble scavenger receptor cysteine-rich domain-containing protein SSC5D-like isoform X2 n=1 Tax=Halichondria panicea TaxID=6063 RepID=UPI00312B7AB7
MVKFYKSTAKSPLHQPSPSVFPLGVTTYYLSSSHKTISPVLQIFRSFSQPSSTTPIWLDELGCVGTESRLIDCYSSVGTCSHSEDVALICTPRSSSSASIAGITIGLTFPVIFIIVVCVVLVYGGLISLRRRRRLARHPRSTPLINNAASTAVVGVTASNTQDTAYPVQQQPMDQTSPYSPQAPPQSMQPVAAYPTGQYVDPKYHTSYPQQPPAPYPTEQPPPAQYPTGQPPPAPYLSGGEAPPAYPN